MRRRAALVLLWLALSWLLFLPETPVRAGEGPLAPAPQVDALVQALRDPRGCPDARTARGLVQAGDAAVPALARVTASPGPLHVRWLAAKILGNIGTEAARLTLIDLLTKERDLAVRGQLCAQLGHLREARAVPALTEGLRSIAQGINDVPGPKEIQPSTCFVRHLEALAIIGDERALPAIEEFARRIPPHVGFGGFVSTVVTGAAQSAGERIRAAAAFRAAVHRQPGLEARIRPLFAYFRTDRVAAFRLYEEDVIRGGTQGREILARLARHPNGAVAGGARELLARYETLQLRGEGAALAPSGPSPSVPARANARPDLDRLELTGQYEEALYYRRVARDAAMAVQVPWSEVGFDPRMDEVYPRLDEIFGQGGRTAHPLLETRVERRVWNTVFSQQEAISRVLGKAKLTPARQQLLDERVRAGVECQVAPEFDEMGGFYHRGKARIFEQTGLLWDASFQRNLLGWYDVRVCAPYFAAIAEELAESGQTALAAAYRARSAWYEREAAREFRRSRGDRALSALKPGDPHRRPTGLETFALLRSGLRATDGDARLAALLLLADLREFGPLLALAQDPEVAVRRELAGIFAREMSIRGLAALADDPDPGVRHTLSEALRPAPDAAGPRVRALLGLREALGSPQTAAFAAAHLAALKGGPTATPQELARWAEGIVGRIRPGLRAEYFANALEAKPRLTTLLRTVDLGRPGGAGIPALLRPYWPKEDALPSDATGPFAVRFSGRIYIPRDGRYRFYVRTSGENRAAVRITPRPGEEQLIVSPRNDPQRLYADQPGREGSPPFRVDFSPYLDLKRGFVELGADFWGPQASSARGSADLQLYWSSDSQVMQPVPATVLFHDA